MATIYTAGYQNWSFYNFRQRIETIGAIVIDVRYSPHTALPFWSKKALQEHLGKNYQHVGELGNINYDNDKEIKIANFDAGFQKVSFWLDLETDIVLLCACKETSKCHRSVVAQKIAQKTGCKIVEL